MKLLLDVTDNKAAFLMELLQSMDFVKTRTVRENSFGQITAIEDDNKPPVNFHEKYYGAITKTSLEETDKQLKELRDDWE
jgi:hypothetical protein